MRTAVVTGVWGESYRELAQITAPRLEEYANRIGAEFVILPDGPPHLSKMFWKLTVRDALAKFDRLIWMDVDCLVRRDCPNLLSIVPHDQWAAYDELETFGELVVWSRHNDMVRVCKEDGLPIPETHGRYFNAGVQVIPAQLAFLYADPPAGADLSDLLGEQHRINVRFHATGHPPFCLPRCFNTITYHLPPRRWESSAFVAHVAHTSHELRMTEIRRIESLWKGRGV